MFSINAVLSGFSNSLKLILKKNESMDCIHVLKDRYFKIQSNLALYNVIQKYLVSAFHLYLRCIIVLSENFCLNNVIYNSMLTQNIL